MAYCILSCDGGGIRGLLPSLLVQRLASDISGFLKNVDLFAGTSAGGLVSLGLASNVAVSEIVSLFENDGPQIFTPYANAEVQSQKEKLRKALAEKAVSVPSESWWQWIVNNFWTIVDEIAYVKYNNTGLQALMKSLLPSTTLGQLPHRVLVTTFQLDNQKLGNWAPITISNFPKDPGAATYPIDAALCTAAAPTYFPPYNHPTYGYCVDGGVYANNPCCMAVASALQSGVPLNEIVVLSIGTGTNPENIQVTPPATNWGPLMWMLPISYNSTPASPILSILMDGVSSADAFICQQLLGTRFLRLQVPLVTVVPLDDYKAVPQLIAAAGAYTSSATWTQAENWVATTFK